MTMVIAPCTLLYSNLRVFSLKTMSHHHPSNGFTGQLEVGLIWYWEHMETNFNQRRRQHVENFGTWEWWTPSPPPQGIQVTELFFRVKSESSGVFQRSLVVYLLAPRSSAQVERTFSLLGHSHIDALVGLLLRWRR